MVIGHNGGSEQLYFYGNAHMRAVRTSDGASIFTIGAGQPVVSPFDGTVHSGYNAYSPFGQLLWQYVYGVTVTVPDVGNNGFHYHATGGPTGYELITLSPWVRR